MKLNMSTSVSLLAILFFTFHVTDDILRNQNGAGQGGVLNILALLTLIVWLYGILMLAEQRSGHIINAVFSFLASVPAVLHMTGWGDTVVGEIAKSSGAFFVWVVVALGVTGITSLIFSVQGLRGQSR